MQIEDITMQIEDITMQILLFLMIANSRSVLFSYAHKNKFR